MGFDDDPFAPPMAESVESVRHANDVGRVWRDGDLMVVRKGTIIPWRCLKCGAPTTAESDLFIRTITWHQPIWHLLLLVNWILYLVAYYTVRRKARIAVGLCPVHRASRVRAIRLGCLASLLGLGMMIAEPIVIEDWYEWWYLGSVMVCGLSLLFGGMIGGFIGSRVFVTQRIDDEYVWLSQVAPELLAELPDWNE